MDFQLPPVIDKVRQMPTLVVFLSVMDFRLPPVELIQKKSVTSKSRSAFHLALLLLCQLFHCVIIIY